MIRKKSRVALSAVLLVATIVLAPAAVSAQVDVSGAWALSVTTDNGVTTPTMALEQDGEAVTGQYSSEALGEVDLRGTVSGSDLTFSFSADVQGQAIPVTYRATVSEEGEMSGTIDIADGMMTGTFTATRSRP